MIARVWEGVVSPERAYAYGEYFRGPLGVVDYRNTPGNFGVTLLRCAEAGKCTFLLVSLWTSRDAIVAYAGADIEKARCHPFDLECLLDPTPTVRHFDVLEHVSG